MRITFYFTCILLQGAICASVPSQKLNSFVQMLLNRQEVVETEKAKDGLQIEEMKSPMIANDFNLGNIIEKYVCHETAVAFHVYLSSSKCYHNGETFKFDRAPINIGRGYEVSTGIFVAPETGLYAFTWTVAAEHGTWFSAELTVNSVVRGTVMADADVGGRASGIHPATGFVLTNVNHGEHVFIRFKSGHGCTVKSDYRIHSTFTGWILQGTQQWE